MLLSSLVLWSPHLLLIHLIGIYCDVSVGFRGVTEEDGGSDRVEGIRRGGNGKGGSRVKEFDFEDLLGDSGKHSSLSPRMVSILDLRKEESEILASCFGLWPVTGSSTIIYDYVDDEAEMLTEEERRRRKEKMKLRKRRKRRNRAKSSKKKKNKNKKTIRVKKKTV